MKTIRLLLSALIALPLTLHAQSWIDITDAYVENPDFNSNTTQGWTYTSNASSQTTGYEAMEFWNGTFNIYQTVNVPNGKYRLSVQAYYRTTDNGYAYNSYTNGSEELTALLYANEKGTPLMSIMEGVQEEPFTYGSSWPTTYGYVPHDMASAAWAFTAGLYQNSLWVYVNDGTLRVGVKKNEGGGYDWTIFDNFNLDYYGTELTADASDELSFKLVYAEQLIKNNPTVIGAVLPALQAEIDAANNIENLDKAIDAFEAAIPVYNELHVLVEQYTDNKRIATEVNAGKAILAEKKMLPTVIFDEIDTGVSGAIASQMGDIMRQIAASRQVISITHLPQVATKGEHHYLVYKEDTNTRTETHIRLLTPEEHNFEGEKMRSV